MSSFVLLTQHGPPDLIVEVGQPISSDPVMLSGLFKAIMSFTDEVAQAPLQVLQTKGFTVQFKTMFEDYVLIVGTNHTIIGLNTILDQISEIVSDGFRNNMDPELIESAITDVLHNYVEFANTGEEFEQSDTIPEDLIEMFNDIPKITYKILFYSLLAGYKLKYPKTDSMDLNRNMVKLIELFELSCCSDLDPNCYDTLTLISKKDKFKLRDEEYRSKEIIQDTKLLQELMKLVKKQRYMEMKIKIQSEMSTLAQLEKVFEDFDYKNPDPQEKEKIDELRYLIGHELEHYLLLRLQRKDPDLVKYLQHNTKQTEWMSTW